MLSLNLVELFWPGPLVDALVIVLLMLMCSGSQDPVPVRACLTWQTTQRLPPKLTLTLPLAPLLPLWAHFLPLHFPIACHWEELPGLLCLMVLCGYCCFCYLWSSAAVCWACHARFSDLLGCRADTVLAQYQAGWGWQDWGFA